MKTVEYINPEGEVVEVPEADAYHFDSIGWPRADKEQGEKTANKGKK